MLVTEEALGGTVVSAQASDGRHLLVANDTSVACYKLSAAAAAAAATDDQAVTRLWEQPVSSGRVEFAAPLTHAADHYLLITSHGGGEPARAAVVQVLPGGGPLLSRSDSGPGAVLALSSGRHHVLAQAELQRDSQHEEPPVRPAFSNLAPCPPAGSWGGGCVLVAALWQATAHVVRAELGAGSTWRLSATATALGELLTAEPGEEGAVQAAASTAARCHAP